MCVQGPRKHVGIPIAILILPLCLPTVVVPSIVPTSNIAMTGFSSEGRVSVRGKDPYPENSVCSQACGLCRDRRGFQGPRRQVGNSGNTGSGEGNEESS